MNLKQTINNSAGPVDRIRDRWADAPGWQRWIVYLAAAAFAFFVLPSDGMASIMSPDADWASVLFYPIGGYILMALGLNIVVGQAGLLDLGYVAFFAIGAYSVAYLGRMQEWNFWPAVLVGVVLAA